MFKKFVFVATAVVLASAGASAQEQVLNLYSARHYQHGRGFVYQLHQGHRHQDQPGGRR
jgi:hypothetical protein